jgi:hypothetical protein
MARAIILAILTLTVACGSTRTEPAPAKAKCTEVMALGSSC